MKLLFLTSRFPFPIEKGDKLRAYYLIKYLSRYHDIYLFAINNKQPDQNSINEVAPYCKAIHVDQISVVQSIHLMLVAITTAVPFQVAYFTGNSVKKKLAEFVKTHHPDKVFCHLIRMAAYADVVQLPDGVIDYMDAFGKGVERLAQHSVWWKRMLLKIEELRVKKYETSTFDHFKHHLIISEQDRGFIQHPMNNTIRVIPNGVDFDYYKPKLSDKKFDLLFIGNMAYPPNIEAATYVVNKIIPLLQKHKPDVTMLIAGATPARQVRNLQSDKVVVTGWIDDVRSVFSSSAIMIAPMLISIGLQNKILQAMAMKTPCVISRLANNAIGAPENCVRVADHPQQYADMIIDLLNNPDKAQDMAERAYTFVKQNFSWENNVNKINQLL